MIKQIRGLGVDGISLAGGEPLMYPHFEEVLRSLKDHGIGFILILTNGTLINRAVAKMLGRYATRVQLSLDGASEEVNDRSRGEGTYSKILRGIDLLIESDVGISLRMTCSDQGVQDVIEMVDFAKNLGAVEFDFRRALPVGRGAEAGISFPKPDQYKILCQTAWERGRALNLQVELGDPFPVLFCNERLRQSAEETPGLQDGSMIGGCSVGTDSVYIAPDGKILLCPYFPLYCGDTRQESLQSIWETSEALRFFRSIRWNLKGRCGACEFRFACGGCRAVAYAITGDVLAEDPGCWHQPATAG